MKTPDRCRSGTPPSAENGLRGLYFGVWCYRRPTIGASPATFHTVSGRSSQNSLKAKFAEFSGSCVVTSRNSLIHNGATPATKSGRFDAEGVPPCCCRVLSAASERLLATLNFREFLFHAVRCIL